jgi:hypothetical protein
MVHRITFSDEQLFKLHKFLKANALKLATAGKISKIPYHPKRPELRDYQWLIVDVDGLGKVEMYFTGMTSHFKVKGVYAENDQIERFNLRALHDVLEKAYTKKVISDAKGFFDGIL